MRPRVDSLRVSGVDGQGGTEPPYGPTLVHTSLPASALMGRSKRKRASTDPPRTAKNRLWALIPVSPFSDYCSLLVLIVTPKTCPVNHVAAPYRTLLSPLVGTFPKVRHLSCKHAASRMCQAIRRRESGGLSSPLPSGLCILAFARMASACSRAALKSLGFSGVVARKLRWSTLRANDKVPMLIERQRLSCLP